MTNLNTDDQYFISFKKMSWLYKKKYSLLEHVSTIRKALRNDSDQKIIRSDILTQYNKNVRVSMLAVQKWILPFLSNDDINRIIVEQQYFEIENIINITITSNYLQATLSEAFANLLEENIRFEIRTLYPKMESMMSDQIPVNHFHFIS